MNFLRKITRSDWVRAITMIVSFITIIQGYLGATPLNQETTIIVSAVLIYLASVLTAIKQSISVEIKTRKALIASIIAVLIATIGGLTDIFNVVHINDILAQWLRFGVTGSILLLNLASKKLFPTQEGKVIEKIKSSLDKTSTN